MPFRNSISAEIARLERERQVAFRRVELAKTMMRAAARREDLDAAVAAQFVAFCAELGWHGENDERRAVLEAWRPVAVAVAASSGKSKPGKSENLAGTDAVDATAVGAAMIGFEAWYTAKSGRPFLAYLDVEIPEMPVVEF
ncbi:MAG: hypothetical protein ACK4MF_00325 [Hyphomicrobiaceae bacterium]